jgi:hypothetical protein
MKIMKTNTSTGSVAAVKKLFATLVVVLITNVVISQDITFDVKTYKSSNNISCNGASDIAVVVKIYLCVMVVMEVMFLCVRPALAQYV